MAPFTTIAAAALVAPSPASGLADVRAIVREALADASTRASLRADDGTSGYLDGFFLSSVDGAFLLRIRMLEQVRWSYNGRAGSASTRESSHGFENKRTRIALSGNLIDPTWTYGVAYYAGYSNSTEDFGTGELSDAFVARSFDDGLAFTAGQFRLPFSAEYATDIAALPFIEYSTVESIFGAGYGQGVGLSAEGDDLRGFLAYANGLSEANAAWSAASPAAEWAVAARLEAKLAGTWRQFESARSRAGEGFGIRIGGAVALERPDAPGADERGVWTADLLLEFGGASATVASFGGWDEDSSGWLVSAGGFIADELELVGRFEAASLADGAGDFSALTVGLNRFIAPSIRLSVDGGYAFDPISPAIAPFARSNNWLADAPGDDGQWVVRTQLGLSF